MKRPKEERCIMMSISKHLEGFLIADPYNCKVKFYEPNKQTVRTLYFSDWKICVVKWLKGYQGLVTLEGLIECILNRTLIN